MKVSARGSFKKLGSRRTLLLAVGAILLIGGGAATLWMHSSFAALPPQEEALRIRGVCESSANATAGEKCIAHELALLAERHGAGYMGDVLSAYQGTTGDYFNCHVLSHRVSNELATRDTGDWRELIRQMSDDGLDLMRCGGGFLHGVIEVAQGKDPSIVINADFFGELCSNTLPKNISTSCQHILGHLLLVQASANVDKALVGCEGLGAEALFQCAGGIFMEDSMRTNLVEHGLVDREPAKTMEWLATQVARCARYGSTGEIVAGCWYDLPEVFAQTHAYDLKKTYAFCLTAPNTHARDECYIRASYLIALAPDDLISSSMPADLCSLYGAGTSALTHCMQDVVGALLSGSLGFLDRTVAFCSARESVAEDACFKMTGSYIARARVSSAERQVLCNKLPETARPSCGIAETI